MLRNDEPIKVKNRDNGKVGYVIPDLNNLNRTFQPQEIKIVPFEELKKLSYLPGGITILRDYLVIDNDEAIKELLGEVEPEYHYTKEEVAYLLKEGTLDQLQDALDFGPEGVKDLIKDIAVEIKLNDINKREIILQKTGFNVTSAIAFNQETLENEKKEVQQRRADPIVKSEDKSKEVQERRSNPIVKPINTTEATVEVKPVIIKK